jgi:hypothetical protein
MNQETPQVEEITSQVDQHSPHKQRREYAQRVKEYAVNEAKEAFDKFVDNLIAAFDNISEDNIKNIINAPAEIAQMSTDTILQMISVNKFVSVQIDKLAFALDKKRSDLFIEKQATLKKEGFALECRTENNGFIVSICSDIKEPVNHMSQVLIAGWLFCEEALKTTAKKTIHIGDDKLLGDLVNRSLWNREENPFQILHKHYMTYKKGFLYYNDKLDVIGMTDYIPKKDQITSQYTARSPPTSLSQGRTGISRHEYQPINQNDDDDDQQEQQEQEQQQIQSRAPIHHVQGNSRSYEQTRRTQNPRRQTEIIREQPVIHHQYPPTNKYISRSAKDLSLTNTNEQCSRRNPEAIQFAPTSTG